MTQKENAIGRHRARIQALELLFQIDCGVYSAEELLFGTGDAPRPLMSVGPAVDTYAERLVRGSVKHKDAFDRAIAAASTNWDISRMPLVDLSIMRLALCEMALIDEVETAVSIDEAVRLAKKYGTEDSPRFINGLLGSIANELACGNSVLGDVCSAAEHVERESAACVASSQEGSANDAQD